MWDVINRPLNTFAFGTTSCQIMSASTGEYDNYKENNSQRRAHHVRSIFTSVNNFVDMFDLTCTVPRTNLMVADIYADDDEE